MSGQLGAVPGNLERQEKEQVKSAGTVPRKKLNLLGLGQKSVSHHGLQKVPVVGRRKAEPCCSTGSRGRARGGEPGRTV